MPTFSRSDETEDRAADLQDRASSGGRAEAAGAGRADGTVAEFDPDRGTGVVDGGDGRRLFFHCTAIADGTRTIAPGTRVTYVVVPGHLGRWEAGDLRPV